MTLVVVPPNANPSSRIVTFCSGCDANPIAEWHTIYAISMDGDLLATHVSTSHAFGREDIQRGEERKKLYAERFPDGYWFHWLEHPRNHPLINLIRANVARRNAEELAAIP